MLEHDEGNKTQLDNATGILTGLNITNQLSEEIEGLSRDNKARETSWQGRSVPGLDQWQDRTTEDEWKIANDILFLA